SRYRLGHVETRATQSGGSWQLSGTKTVVPGGGHAGAFIVSARVSGGVDDPSGIALFLVSRGEAGVKLRGYPTQDGACAADLTLADAAAVELLPAGAAFGVLEHAIDIGIAALCAEAVGAMDKLVAVTVEYMNTRKQFGVAIATFQALRHRIADVKMQLELARSMSYYATLKLGEEPPARRRALAQAKVQLGNSMRYVGQQCIQLHGGIGVTDEYAASHYFKRLTVIEMTFGDTLFQLGEVSRRMQTTAGVFA
ncbi:MAG TPA: acyl-CoA dehydrogenase family protein, partial [Caldimonas sp.]|nr:acyl-CoA dehydrogenase family protein [Caldimonas sp.]